MSSNMERLGDIFTSRMKRTSSAAVPTTLELGVINNNLSIKVDSLPDPIPKGDYMVNYLISGAKTSTAGSHGGHMGADQTAVAAGSHSHEIPSLKSGDRVLVAWCGNEPVVIAVVVSS